MHSLRTRGSRLVSSARLTRRAPIVAAVQSTHSTLTLAHTPNYSIGSTNIGAVPCVAARPFSSDAAGPAAAAAASSDDGDGRQSAPAGEEPQGQSKEETKKASSILDVDPYPPEKIAALEKKYGWVDFNAMAQHLHMTDVHFFDQEVPYVDQDFTIKP